MNNGPFYIFSWDEWVPENRVLKYNEVNVQKQKEVSKLQEDRIERVESMITNLIQIIGSMRKEQHNLEEKLQTLQQQHQNLLHERV